MTGRLSDSELVGLFYRAAIFLIDRVRHHGWQKCSANYLREHVRCESGAVFGNSRSPEILRLLLLAHPELGEWIKAAPTSEEKDHG